MKRIILVLAVIAFLVGLQFLFQENLSGEDELLLKTVFGSNKEGAGTKRVVETSVNRDLVALGDIELVEEGEDYTIKVYVSSLATATSMVTLEAKIIEPGKEDEPLFTDSRTGTKRDTYKLSRALVDNIDKKFLKGKYKEKEVDLTERVEESIKTDIVRADERERSLQAKVTEFVDTEKARIESEGDLKERVKDYIAKEKELITEVKDKFPGSRTFGEITSRDVDYYSQRLGSVAEVTDKTQGRVSKEYLRSISKDLKKKGVIDKELTEREINFAARFSKEAPDIAQITQEAKMKSKLAHSRNPKVPEDAYRHVLWAYLLTKKFGSEFARKVTITHEVGPTGNTQAEKRMDINNNSVGVRYATLGLTEEEVLRRVMVDPAVIRSAK